MLSLNDEEALQRLGPVVPTEPAQFPARVTIPGQYIDLVPLSTDHTEALYPLVALPEHERLWDYMLEGPFNGDRELFVAYMSARTSNNNNMVFWVIVDKQPASYSAPTILGIISYLNINPKHRTIEIGNILFSSLLQRSRKSSEAVFLMLKHAFDDLGYRRVEWKCNNLNLPSKRAATRYGFTYEGLFRKMLVLKGRNRDTAWFSVVDDEWPQRKAALEAWLSPDNFDPQTGAQILTLKQAHAKFGYAVPESLQMPAVPL
ncbi:GNAT domain protein [Kalmanozyma brasiliensis GHG001]|uniref:N-acetyltransferase domain-containing protein n=1 Tax=Kalmanozyma brasiliensis (strain GHG001) TaxID=1365824 RepID=V5ERV9_KALBG|nr:GNAT domain protein [Kalmanozyma brasiliensis GHG001]EST07890.1 GNAT domain protein [Kalmanozyma brasiliensis GHG001]